MECGTDLTCVSGCSRTVNECMNGESFVFVGSKRTGWILDCPCLLNCPLGCKDCRHPMCNCIVPEDSIEYFDCSSSAEEKEKRCVVDCGIHNTTCHQSCEETYNNTITACPCMDDCKKGCPCDGYICREQKVLVEIITLQSHKLWVIMRYLQWLVQIRQGRIFEKLGQIRQNFK